MLRNSTCILKNGNEGSAEALIHDIFLLYVVLSVIAPKNVDNIFIDMIKVETTALVERLITSSAASKGGVDSFKHLHLNSMNIVFSSAFGKQYKGIDDPEFDELSDVINELISLGSLESDLANFLPIFSLLDYFLGKRAYIMDFFDNKRNPLYRNLIREASNKEGNNLVKLLDEFELTEDDKLVTLCKVKAVAITTS